MSGSAAQWVGNVILLVAAVAAFWYTHETRKLRLQMIRPKVVFLFDPATESLTVRNVGNGPALNISLERIQLDYGSFELEPPEVALLEKGEGRELSLRPHQGNHRPDITVILSDSSVWLQATARYSNVEGGPFVTSTFIGAGARLPFIQDA